MTEGKELILIGTVHGDPDGAARLLELLRRESPSVVLVEASPFGIAYRRAEGRRLLRLLRKRVDRISRFQKISWRGRGQIEALFSRVRMPFEYSSSLRFCRDSGGSIQCIDLSSESRRMIGLQWREWFSVENIQALMREPPEDPRSAARKTYALASRLLGECEKTLLNLYVREWMEEPWREREAHLAEQVGSRFDRMTTGRLAYVGGWQHLLHPTDAATLCDRLSHLLPRRKLLGVERAFELQDRSELLSIR